MKIIVNRLLKKAQTALISSELPEPTFITLVKDRPIKKMQNCSMLDKENDTSDL